jgi:DNA mismatch repair ATPase MutS
MDPYANNYVLSIHVEIRPATLIQTANISHNVTKALNESQEAKFVGSMPIGLAWIDLSTGHFFTQSTTLSSLPSVLSRISPSEIVMDEDLQSVQNHGVFSILNEERHLVSYLPATALSPISEWTNMLETEVSPVVAEEFTNEEVAAGSVLLRYVETRLRGFSTKLQPPQRFQTTDVMGIDRNSMRALEIKETLQDGAFKGSLLHAVRRTVTKSGARLLRNWLGMSGLV